MTDYPVLCEWDGEALRPHGRNWARQADKQWTVGEQYMVEIRHERSSASHRAYFAAINDAFENLPADLAERFKSPEALRKAALIQCGYRDERSIVANSKAEAQRLAAFVQPMDEYAIVSVSGTTVVVLTARSQNMRAMGRQAFEESKNKVLDFLASLIGTTPDQLGRAA